MAYKEGSYKDALSIYEGAYNRLQSIPKNTPCTHQLDFIDTLAFLQSRIIITYACILPTVNISQLISGLENEWNYLNHLLIEMRKNTVLIEPYQTLENNLLTTPIIQKETWGILARKCKKLSDHLYNYFVDEHPNNKSILDETIAWMQRAIDLSNRFHISITPETHLDMLNLLEEQLRFVNDNDTRDEILIRMLDYINAHDLLNEITKKQKLELFGYYFTCTPNLTSDQLNAINLEAEEIISKLKKSSSVIGSIRLAFADKKRKVLEAENNAQIFPQQPLSQKSILSKMEKTPSLIKKSISLSFFPTVNWIEKESPTSSKKPSNRLISAIKSIPHAYCSKEFSVKTIALCSAFFMNYAMDDCNQFACLLAKMDDALSECQGMAEEKHLSFLITTLTSVLIAFESTMTEGEHRVMVDVLLEEIVKMMNKDILLFANTGITAAMKAIFTNDPNEETTQLSL